MRKMREQKQNEPKGIKNKENCRKRKRILETQEKGAASQNDSPGKNKGTRKTTQ